jgi:hypothetical protein
MLQGSASAAERAASRIYLAVSNPKVTFERSKQLRSMVRELDKCSVASRKCPLREPDVLRLIFELVGPGDWAFTAAVSASWASTYKEVLAKSADANNFVVSSTSTSAVCSSAARLRWAHHAAMQLSTEQQWTKLGKVADVETVAAAHELFEPDAAAVGVEQWRQGACSNWPGCTVNTADVARLCMMPWWEELAMSLR